jgi:regulator of protease activity HflC (stomatin/prohibitin superfamily)
VNGIGDFLLRAVEWLWDFWPIRIVNAWEAGVRLRGGKPTALLGQGVHFFWPILGEILVQEVNIETPVTEPQDVYSAEGTAWCLSIAITYRIKDLRALYSRVHDADETIQAEVRAAAAHVAAKMTDDEMGQLGDRTLVEAKKATHGWGLDLQRTRPVTLVPAQTLRLVGGSPRE